MVSKAMAFIDGLSLFVSWAIIFMASLSCFVASAMLRLIRLPKFSRTRLRFERWKVSDCLKYSVFSSMSSWVFRMFWMHSSGYSDCCSILLSEL